jgi:ACR3 family arsenite efflux pump ArsB
MEHTKQHALVMWIIWFAQLQAAFVFQFFLGNGFESAENADSPMAFGLWLLCLVPLVLAAGIRWFAIPKARQVVQQLVMMIVGLGLVEASVLCGIFLVAPDYPQYQIALLMVAVASLIQFAPSYATPGYKQV